LVFTVQKEVASRMCAHAGSASYSGYSVLCQAHCRVRPSGDLAPGVFYPAPEVNSTIVVLERIDGNPVVDAALFAGLVRAAFSSRRKTLQNNLLSSELARERGTELLREACASTGVDLSERAERVPPEKFVALANAIAGSAIR
ncbi:MAG TPA: rRNA adenine N-6-methyltransferase family protein, partial [Spirochaetia bacterium]|nr:rRNA adenine N-6-methyltransferase family protein [Spirochaetia bacterium]